MINRATCHSNKRPLKGFLLLVTSQIENVNSVKSVSTKVAVLGLELHLCFKTFEAFDEATGLKWIKMDEAGVEPHAGHGAAWGSTLKLAFALKIELNDLKSED